MDNIVINDSLCKAINAIKIDSVLNTAERRMAINLLRFVMNDIISYAYHTRMLQPDGDTGCGIANEINISETSSSPALEEAQEVT
ncbi:MAG: hypothetical protein ACOWWR_18405 [Eubacteriales bacterium]